jgi:hypothetical protein
VLPQASRCTLTSHRNQQATVRCPVSQRVMCPDTPGRYLGSNSLWPSAQMSRQPGIGWRTTTGIPTAKPSLAGWIGRTVQVSS